MDTKGRYSFVIFVICRLIIGMMFLASSAPKLLRPDLFFQSILDYNLFGHQLAYVGAVVVPSLELVLGLLLLGGVMVGPAFMVGAALMAFFTGLHAWLVINGIEASCGCFSVSGDDAPVSWLSVGRNGLLLAVAITGAVFTLRPTHTRRPSPPAAPPATPAAAQPS